MFDFCRLLARESRALVVAFDLRNHGARLADSARNLGWPENHAHAEDMYSFMLGTGRDVATLIDVMPVHFPELRQGTRWCCVGFSMGTPSSFQSNDWLSKSL